MGQFHLKHLSRHPKVELVAVADTDPERRTTLAQKYKTTAYSDPSELLGKIDAAIIATPTPAHYDIGRRFLEAGISCLIEKPLASTIEEAEYPH